MEASFIGKQVKKNIVYRYKFQILIGVIILSIIAISITKLFQTTTAKPVINPDLIYNTWKVEKVYKNGKLVFNNNKYNNLFFQVNKDGTAEWINENKTLKLNFSISPDGTQMIFDDGLRVEEVETIFELRPTLLRFGKRTINSQYEYVLTAEDIKGSNFF